MRIVRLTMCVGESVFGKNVDVRITRIVRMTLLSLFMIVKFAHGKQA